MSIYSCTFHFEYSTACTVGVNNYMYSTCRSCMIYMYISCMYVCVCVSIVQVLSDEEYSEWMVERHAAELALEGRDKLLFDSACVIENKLKLLGQ